MEPIAIAAPAQPVLETPRLLLRPFTPQDAPRVQELAGDVEIADTTLSIPHPYPDGAAASWISTLGPGWEHGDSAVFAIVPRDGEVLAGAIGLELSRTHRRAEMGYWIGKPYWNQGLCTEAARAIAAYAFEGLRLERVVGHYLSRNPASGAVMRKIGMRHEGTMRRHILKWGELEDIEIYGLLRGELIVG